MNSHARVLAGLVLTIASHATLTAQGPCNLGKGEFRFTPSQHTTVVAAVMANSKPIVARLGRGSKEPPTAAAILTALAQLPSVSSEVQRTAAAVAKCLPQLEHRVGGTEAEAVSALWSSASSAKSLDELIQAVALIQGRFAGDTVLTVVLRIDSVIVVDGRSVLYTPENPYYLSVSEAAAQQGPKAPLWDHVKDVAKADLEGGVSGGIGGCAAGVMAGGVGCLPGAASGAVAGAVGASAWMTIRKLWPFGR